MKTRLLALLFTSLAVSALAQQAGVIQLEGYEIDFTQGTFQGSFRPSGKLSVTYTGRSGPAHVVGQESGTKRLAGSKVRSIRREFIARSIVIHAQEVTRGKQKVTELKEATAKNEVTVLVEQINSDGQKSTLKVRCDQAVFTAGVKPKTGRVEFSGNAKVWAYGMSFLQDGELSTTGGWIDLGDPDDLENKPVSFSLDAPSGSVKVRDTEGKKK
jgi:hypothetical protein